MKTQIQIGIIALGALIAVGIYSNWQTAVAIFTLMWMNNIEQRVMSIKTQEAPK